MRMQVGHSGSYNDETEDGQDLVCIQDPLFHLQVVIGVEATDLLRDTLRAAHDGLHFGYRCPRLSQLVEDQHAVLVGLGSSVRELRDGQVLQLVVHARTRRGWCHMCLQCFIIKTILLLDRKRFRTCLLQTLQNLGKLFLTAPVKTHPRIEDNVVDWPILEQYGCCHTENILVVGYEVVKMIAFPWKCYQPVVIYYGLAEQHKELSYAVCQICHPETCLHWVWVMLLQIAGEHPPHLAQDRQWIVQVSLQYHCELKKVL